MRRRKGRERADEKLRKMINEMLRNQSQVRLHVDEIDVGLFVSPAATTELIKTPVYVDEIKENIGMLIDLKVREDTTGLSNKVVMRMCIDEDGKVKIRNSNVHEAEIMEEDVHDGKLSNDREEILSRKEEICSRVVMEAMNAIKTKSPSRVSF